MLLNVCDITTKGGICGTSNLNTQNNSVSTADYEPKLPHMQHPESKAVSPTVYYYLLTVCLCYALRVNEAVSLNICDTICCLYVCIVQCECMQQLEVLLPKTVENTRFGVKI